MNPEPGPLVVVDEVDDPRLDPYRKLKDPAGRARLEAERAFFVVEGRLAVERLLASDYEVDSLLVDDRQATSAAHLVEVTRAQGAPVYVGSSAVVAATVGFALHRGVVAVGRRPPPLASRQLLSDIAGLGTGRRYGALVAVLEGLNDHENIGSLFRNAAAFGVAGILLDPSCADPLYRRSIRVSVGHVLHLPFARLAPWPEGLQQLREAGFLVVATTPSSPSPDTLETVTLRDLPHRLSSTGPSRGVALLFGAEGGGLTPEALHGADLAVSTPMADGVDSLNVATAAAVAFFTLAG